MKFSVDIDILAGRERLLQVFMDLQQIKNWRSDVSDFNVLAGKPGESGASIHFTRKMGTQMVAVIETLESNTLPNEITYTYSAPQLWYRCKNSFIQIGKHKTTWIREFEFRTTGIYKAIRLVAPGWFRKQALKEMQDFKRYCQEKVFSELEQF